MSASPETLQFITCVRRQVRASLQSALESLPPSPDLQAHAFIVTAVVPQGGRQLNTPGHGSSPAMRLPSGVSCDGCAVAPSSVLCSSQNSSLPARLSSSCPAFAGLMVMYCTTRGAVPILIEPVCGKDRCQKTRSACPKLASELRSKVRSKAGHEEGHEHENTHLQLWRVDEDVLEVAIYSRPCRHEARDACTINSMPLR